MGDSLVEEKVKEGMREERNLRIYARMVFSSTYHVSVEIALSVLCSDSLVYHTAANSLPLSHLLHKNMERKFEEKKKSMPFG